MKTYSVKFMYISYADAIYRDDIDFSSREEAQNFINKIKNKDVKKICYIYLTTVEKIL